MGHRFSFEPRSSGKALLDAYDSATSPDYGAEKLDLARQKFDFEKTKAGFDQAQRTQQLEQRATGLEQKATSEAGRADVAERNLKLKEGMDEFNRRKAEADIAESNAKLADMTLQQTVRQRKEDETIKALDHANTYFQETKTLDPRDPDFEKKYADIKLKTLAGVTHPDVQEYDKYILGQRAAANAHILDLKAKADQDAAKLNDNLAAQQRAIVSGSRTFGHLDEKGKIVPDAAGGTATHVSSFYANPVTGKMEQTPPMTIDEFKQIEAKVAAPPATAAPAPNSGPVPVVTIGATMDQPPDIKALAQKALDDPSATAEHKAAAQKILANQ